PGDEARHLSAAGRVTDMDGVLQVQMLGNSRGVGGVVIHVVPVADLFRTSMPAPVMGDDAIALLEEEEHLVVPVVCRQRPAVVEMDWLSLFGAPVLVEDVDTVGGGH